jgi:Flp pilus assembly protein TadD
MLMKRHDEASTHCKEAISLGLSDEGMLHNLARSFRKEARNEEALTVLQRIHQLNPSDSDGQIELAQCLECLDRSDEAIEIYQRAILGDSRNPSLRHALGLSYVKRGESRAARSQYERLKMLDGELATKLLREIEK